MSNVATKFQSFGTKFQMGGAACAIAAAAVLTPAAVAHADPVAPAPMVGALGSLINAPDCTEAITTNCTPPIVGTFSPSLSSSPGSIFKNPLLWIGTPNPNPPASTRIIWTFQPLNLLPAFVRPLFGWFANINFQACIAGISVRVGPYGTISGSIGRGC